MATGSALCLVKDRLNRMTIWLTKDTHRGRDRMTTTNIYTYNLNLNLQ